MQTIRQPTTTSIKDASSFIKSEFNLDLSLSSLKHYSNSQWDKFCDLNNFDNSASGLYIPKSYAAYVKPSSFLINNIFHEL